MKTIDVHSHCLFHESVNMMGDKAKGVLQNVKDVVDEFIDMEELSVNPFCYRKDRDTAAAIVIGAPGWDIA